MKDENEKMGLGSIEFKKTYCTKYAYMSGSMYKGISSKYLVQRMANSGFLSFLGSGGISYEQLLDSLRYLQQNIKNPYLYGVNFLNQLDNTDVELELIQRYMEFGVVNIEVAAYVSIRPALVLFRLKGLTVDGSGACKVRHQLIAKVSNLEVAKRFMEPPPLNIVSNLLECGLITEKEAYYSQKISTSSDVCVESDSGGHTSQGVAVATFPSFIRLRNRIMEQYCYSTKIRVGGAGGIGSPESAACYFFMGADFVTTGSINQCTVEAGTSDEVKNLLAKVTIDDMAYAPAGDMFEFGAKVQVVKKDTLFHARAKKLYDLYMHYSSLDALKNNVKSTIERDYFGRSIKEVWDETKTHYGKKQSDLLKNANVDARVKMALVFRWYFIYSTRLAMSGNRENKINYQIQCGPAMGAFNDYVRGTELENWRNRHVDVIARKLMEDASHYMKDYYENTFKEGERYV